MLYRTVQAHWLQFLADIEAEGGELPAFVKDEFAAYLRCGILAHGLLRIRCKECGHSRVVGFSCRRRGFCPSCLGRRMADTAAFCVDHLFPKVPVRQFVLSVPISLRFRMAYSPDLTSAVLRCFIAAITGDPTEPRQIDPSGIPRFNRLPWAVLLKRVFLVDVLECPKCKGRMKILAAVVAPASVRRVLESLGLPSEAPRLQAARPPPQTELEDQGAQSGDFYADPPCPEE